MHYLKLLQACHYLLITKEAADSTSQGLMFGDGAVRGFKRSTYFENGDMLVRFTDDAGVHERRALTQVAQDENF